MIISIASGKGGTGKTTVAVALASALKKCAYIDCDVEEPNGHILLKPEIQSETAFQKLLPKIEYSKCTFCGKCVEVCEFNALLNFKTEIVLLEELCHSCGACSYFCPENAITEEGKTLGFVRKGIVENYDIQFYDGILNIGEATAAPLIREVKLKILPDRVNIIDSPPGTSCSMVEAVRNSDYSILVTESTPFGLHDLKLAVDVLGMLVIPFGVVINKYDESFKELEAYLEEKKIPIFMKIPFDKSIAVAYSKGAIPHKVFEKMGIDFGKMFDQINRAVAALNGGTNE